MIPSLFVSFQDVVEEILGLAKSGSKSVYIQCASGKLSTVALYKSSTPSETITRHEVFFSPFLLT